MRKTLFMIIFFLGFCLPMFSQSSDIIRIQPETTYKNYLPANMRKPLVFRDSVPFTKVAKFPSGKKYNDRSQIGINFQNVNTSMPTYKPDGTYYVQIHIPDSTITYTLLTKKYPQQ